MAGELRAARQAMADICRTGELVETDGGGRRLIAGSLRAFLVADGPDPLNRLLGGRSGNGLVPAAISRPDRRIPSAPAVSALRTTMDSFFGGGDDDPDQQLGMIQRVGRRPLFPARQFRGTNFRQEVSAPCAPSSSPGCDGFPPPHGMGRLVNRPHGTEWCRVSVRRSVTYTVPSAGRRAREMTVNVTEQRWFAVAPEDRDRPCVLNGIAPAIAAAEGWGWDDVPPVTTTPVIVFTKFSSDLRHFDQLAMSVGAGGRVLDCRKADGGWSYFLLADPACVVLIPRAAAC